MSMARRFACDACKKSLTVWEDGNPYYIEGGRKHYAYHPDHENLTRCIGNDTPHLCLDCGRRFNVDSNAPVSSCPKCGSPDIAAAWTLDGRRCPKCKRGTFRVDPEYFAVS